MKTSNSTPKNNKTSILVCLILLAISSPVFSQNKLASLVYSVNPSFAIPIICLCALTVLLVTAFMKQKNH